MKASVSRTWTVAEAKAQLSEVMRRARSDGPQYIGSKSPCVVISEEEWQRLTQATPKLGDWLVQNLAGLGEIPLPSRVDPPRDILFQEDL